MPERIGFTTSDGVRIVGDRYAPAAPSVRGVLLLHMMPETRASWAPLAGMLTAAGFEVFAIDERGHGESTKTTDGRTLDYHRFVDAEQQAKILDVEAAVAWLKSQNVKDVSIVGASIGANLALQYAAAHHDVAKIVVLAPGLNYRGVETLPAVTRLNRSQKVLFITAKDDDESYGSVQELSERMNAQATSHIYESGGHAQRLFTSHPESLELIVDFLK